MTHPETETWRANISMEHLRLRAQMLVRIRQFFSDRQVLEVETPILSCAGTTDPNIESFRSSWQGPQQSGEQELFLITSPEFHMKRLLASGSGCIYQLARVFRQGELGSRHTPEFTLLEWYRVGLDYFQLMAEVEALLRDLLAERNLSLEPTLYLSYQQAFEQYLGINPLNTEVKQLTAIAQSFGYQAGDGDKRDTLLDLLMSAGVQPALPENTLVFIHDYPASQAALARLNPVNPVTAQRFELFYQGVELANGFQELTDGEEQAKRFRQDLKDRRQQNKADVIMDEQLICALKNGLPECAGVALGFDRFFQIVTNSLSIDKILAFPINRA